MKDSARKQLKIKDGIVLVGSDLHIWPGKPSDGFRAFVHFLEAPPGDLKAVVLNGDVIDASSISRHPPIGWEKQPDICDELAAADEALEEISAAAKKARRLWTLGNHDLRFNTRIASLLPEFRGVAGTRLKDHFPDWEPAWSVSINEGGPGATVVKHRFKGGANASFANAQASGVNIVTGHLHSMRVSPFTDYRGTRFGVDGGMLADPRGRQFLGYTEDNPLNWRQGFVVLTFKGGRLLWPEFVHVTRPNWYEWRGQEYKL